MNKERREIELLQRALKCVGESSNEDLCGEIEVFLAQPEQEPEAWMVETHFNNEPIKEFHTVKPMERVYKYCKVTELFTEKHHGITGGM